MQCSVVRGSAVQCSDVQCSAVHFSAVQLSAVQERALKLSAVQESVLQLSAVQESVLQLSAVRLNSVSHPAHLVLFTRNGCPDGVSYSEVQCCAILCSEVQGIFCSLVQHSAALCSAGQCSVKCAVQCAMQCSVQPSTWTRAHDH